MTATLDLVLAQLNPVVGDVAGNTDKAIDAALRARDRFGAHLVVLPELFLSGYPPEDLLFHKGLKRRTEAGLERIRAETPGIAVLVGFPEYANDGLYNAAALIDNGRFVAHYRKWLLPNYRVFDEKRYFESGSRPCVVELRGVRIGLQICEDIWQPEPAAAARTAGAEVLLAINGSPYQIGAQARREQVAAARVRETRLPLVYVNMVGGQDELVFDGGSFVMNDTADVVLRANDSDEQLIPVGVEADSRNVHPLGGEVVELPGDDESVYRALVRGTRDYVEKNGFPGVILGLSGGVDSALTLAVAVDALGAERVHAVMMPYRYTSEMSRDDAADQARALGVRYDVISIEPMVDAALTQLEPIFAGRERDATEENIQSRMRGVLLMALSNKMGWMLLTTGNKSEMAVGYATLYGDMAGGFAPLKDCSKTLVYRLAAYRNGLSSVIPQRVIDREPSAELAPDQKDSDSLPPYDVLDPVLATFIEEDLSVEEIVARGFEFDTVVRILSLVRRNEYKRRQAPPGVRISDRGFGRDWRYPITSGYRFPA